MNKKTPNYITATDARKDIFQLVSRVKDSPLPVGITINGIPEAMLLGRETYEALIETIDTLTDVDLMKQIMQSNADVKNGKYRNWESIKKEIFNE